LGYLTALLNSKLFRFAFKDYFPELLGDTKELSKVFFEKISIIQVSDDLNVKFEELTELMYQTKRKGLSATLLETEMNDKIYEIYSLSDNDKLLISSVNIGFDEIEPEIMSASTEQIS